MVLGEKGPHGDIGHLIGPEMMWKYEILALKHRDIESSDILCITSASVLEVIMETKLLF